MAILSIILSKNPNSIKIHKTIIDPISPKIEKKITVIIFPMVMFMPSFQSKNNRKEKDKKPMRYQNRKI